MPVQALDTVYDYKTKLTWQRGASPTQMHWSESLTYCADLPLASPGTWRLPTVKELITILDVTQLSPMVDMTAFPSTPAATLWTSTPSAKSPDSAWSINFDTGGVNPAVKDELFFYVRCVR